MHEPWKGAARPRDLAAEDFARAARRLGCAPAAIRAVWEVEAAGRHFLADGSVIRRFEPHHFPRHHWPAIGFDPRAGEAPWRASLRLSSEAMFRRAAALDLTAALRASSWGAPQIMGFNHAEAGFASPLAMVVAMAEGAPQQLDAFTDLLRAWGLDAALRGHDWAGFARRYNGSGQVETYARRMEAAWRRHSGGAASPVVLRVGARGAAVRRLQQALGVADDGVFGPETLAAVEALQRSHGLPVDGVVGRRTWAALEAPAAPPPPPQQTPADALLERTKDWSAAAGAVAAAVGTATQALPEAAVTLLVFAAVALGLIAATAWVLRRARS